MIKPSVKEKFHLSLYRKFDYPNDREMVAGFARAKAAMEEGPLGAVHVGRSVITVKGTPYDDEHMRTLA